MDKSMEEVVIALNTWLTVLERFHQNNDTVHNGAFFLGSLKVDNDSV